MAALTMFLLILAHAYSCSGAQADHGQALRAALRNPNIIAWDTPRTNLTTSLDLTQKEPTVNYRHFDTQKYNKEKVVKRVKREEDQGVKCEAFAFNDKEMRLTHPHDRISQNKSYYNDTECVTVIEAKLGQIIKVTFLDFFHIEYHRNCSYDYLEIRDGKYGYARSLGKLCGNSFPDQFSTTGPFMWLKFFSDATLSYEGFHMSVIFEDSVTSRSTPDSCYIPLEGISGDVNPDKINEDCKKESSGKDLEVVWTITTEKNTGIYLSFFNDSFNLAKPNECDQNIVQVFGSKMEEDHALAHYCGSIANSIFLTNSTDSKFKDLETNILHIRMFHTVTTTRPKFLAKYTAFRTLNFTSNEECLSSEFNCGDNTCIDSGLLCNSYGNCRLKTDEDPDKCNKVTSSLLSQEGVLMILVIFCLILSGMCFVFLFKCIKKLYQDQIIINEHIKQCRLDALDSILGGSQFKIDPKMFQRDLPRASLERDNRANELVKQREQKLSGPIKSSSSDSEFPGSIHLDLQDDPWRRDAKSAPIDAHDVKIEKNGRPHRNEANRDSFRSKREEMDTSVETDTKESGCQTRESLFETGQPSKGSSNNSRGPPSPAAPSPPPTSPAPGPNASQITIELKPAIRNSKTQKKMSDRRPMSAETTRSAPDVIILAPLR